MSVRLPNGRPLIFGAHLRDRLEIDHFQPIYYVPRELEQRSGDAMNRYAERVQGEAGQASGKAVECNDPQQTVNRNNGLSGLGRFGSAGDAHQSNFEFDESNSGR